MLIFSVLSLAMFRFAWVYFVVTTFLQIVFGAMVPWL